MAATSARSERKRAARRTVFKGRIGGAGDGFLNETVVQTDAQLVVKQAQQNRPFMGIGSLDKLLELSQFFSTRPFAAGFGDLAETVRDIFQGQWRREWIFCVRDFRCFKKSARSDVKRTRIRNRKRPAGQKSDAGSDLVALKPLEIGRCRSNLRQSAWRFLKLVAQGSKFSEVH